MNDNSTENNSGENKSGSINGQDSGVVSTSPSAESFFTDVAHLDNKIHSDNKGIVVARGTGEGLVLRLDGRVAKDTLLTTLTEYVESRSSFFSGQEVTLEWTEARPEEGVVSELSRVLCERFQLLVKASRMFERHAKASNKNKGVDESLNLESSPNLRTTQNLINTQGLKTTPVSPVGFSEQTNIPSPATRIPPGSDFISPHASTPRSLFDGVASFGGTSGNAALSGNAATNISYANQNSSSANRSSSTNRGLISEALLWDEADTRIIRETLRGGQKIESEHSVVIVGDVNSGAEIVAGGDIFVLGRLRGVAHAGAYDESGGGRKIFALQMQPTQLRIGSIISQGSEEGGRMPEVAKVEATMIVVEPYGASSQVRRVK